MERVLIEELVNSRQYNFTLDFELPLNLSMALHPEVTGHVENVRQHLRPEGLMISGELVEQITLKVGNQRKELDHSFHFTYLIPGQDLVDANLLNFEIQVSIEQMQYHLMKKKGHVLLHQQFELKVEMAEYHLRDHSFLPKGGMQKKTGLFLQATGECQKSFLKLYPIRLPDDYSLLSKLSGIVDHQEVELTPEGCLLDLSSRIQGEYVTDTGKLGTFFFERTENLFLPITTDSTTPIDEVVVEVELRDIALEKDGQVMVLYHCQIFLYQKCEVAYYTGRTTDLPPGTQISRVEVEQIGHPLTSSQLVEEKLDLTQLPIQQVTDLIGQCLHVQVETGTEQIFLTAELEYQITYLSATGIEQTRTWGRVIEEMLSLPPQAATREEVGGQWRFAAQVQTPEWQFDQGQLRFDTLVDFRGAYHQRQVEPIVTQLPASLEEQVTQESFYLTEEVGGDQIQFQGEERIYLQRYASEILRCHGEVVEWQTRQVQGGWMVRGQGELTIYYLSAEGERHYGHPFRFYQYIPSEQEPAQLLIRLVPSIRILDHELLEDGSVVQLQYLGKIRYTLLRQREMSLVTGVEWGLARSSRTVLGQGCIEERVEERLSLEEGGFFTTQRVRQIQELTLELKDYQVRLDREELVLVGELEAQVKYETGWGKERWKLLPLRVRLKEKLSAQGEPCQQFRVAPIIKGYEYMLTGHPQHPGQIQLCINLELHYRLVGKLSDLCERTLPSRSTS